MAGVNSAIAELVAAGGPNFTEADSAFDKFLNEVLADAGPKKSNQTDSLWLIVVNFLNNLSLIWLCLYYMSLFRNKC